MIKPNKLPKESESILNSRLADEYSAHYFYRALSNWCSGAGFEKAAKYFFAESQSELEHAKGIEDFMVGWNVTPKLPPIKSPTLEFSGLVAGIEAAYKIEYALYENYENDSATLINTGDMCVFDFLQRYRNIQTESVKEYSDMINILEGVDVSDKFQLLMLEEKLF